MYVTGRPPFQAVFGNAKNTFRSAWYTVGKEWESGRYMIRLSPEEV
jgi:hypothetical protein